MRLKFYELKLEKKEMNEQIQQEILKYLQAFEVGVEQAGTFTAEQVPLVVQEFIRWQIWGNLLEVLYFGLSLFICYKLFLKLKKDLLEFVVKNKYTSGAEVLYIPLTIVALIFAIFFFCALSSAAKALVAPRVVVIEKISELTKGVK